VGCVAVPVPKIRVSAGSGGRLQQTAKLPQWQLLATPEANALVFASMPTLSRPMPHDPHAKFDHDVLEMIEQSPVGAVPRTPSYQDAIERLIASHQIYPDADHANGFVTVRSLSARAPFHANNLDALMKGTITADALEGNAGIYDRYVAALAPELRPKAETHRSVVAGRPAQHRKHGGIVAHDPVHTLFLVPGAGPHPGIPGNYLYGSLLQLGTDPVTGAWSIQICDRDDGAAQCDAPTLAEALAKVEEVIASAPFHLNELGALGFRAN
jgi:hypothetical protein